MLHLYKSNQMDALLGQLTPLLKSGQQGPFDFVLICAPDGIHEQIKVALAEAHDVFAGEIVSPRNGVEQLICRLTSIPPNSLLHHGDAVLFHICNILLEQLETAPFAPVRQYLGKPFSMQKLLSLASILSGLFGEYTLYRPDMLARWQMAPEDWQEILMARVATRFSPHVGAGVLQAVKKLQLDDTAASNLPRRMVMFGISSLPPVFLQMISAASINMDVHLFVITPSMDYFESRGKRVESAPENASQNGLLSLLGTQPSLFQDALISMASQVPLVEHDLFEAELPATVLGEVQRGLLFNQPVAPIANDGVDASVQFHECTGIGREVEVVVAAVLRQIMDEGVAPSDVVVMAPDINDYAPWIDAAMLATGVPYTISDRNVSASPGAAEATEGLLQLMTSRLTLQEVFSILEMAPISRRFSMDEADVRSAWKWCVDARIRSCIDAMHRKQLGLEPFSENTWRFGLNRMLLGIAMEGEDRLFGGVSPVSAYVGTDAAKLGCLLTFLESIFALVETCRAPHSVSDWCVLWDTQLATFLPPGTDGLARVRSVFQQLSEQATGSEFGVKIDFAAFRTLIKGRVSRALFASGSGFGVRFSSFRFMRGDSVPVVAILGMDEGKFPQDSRAPSFDRIAARPQPGDRDLRQDGYHMFLEAVMAASRQLLVVYGGSAETAGEAVKPCVPVRQLQGAVAEAVSPTGQRANIPPIHLRHPVHSHAPVYFDPDSPAYVNFKRSDFLAALAMRGQESSIPQVAPSQVSDVKSFQDVFQRPSEIPDSGITMALQDFFRFWKNPPLFYLEQTLGMAFPEPAEMAPDDEPLQLAGLDEWHVGNRFIEALLSDLDWQQVMPVVRALGIAPTGNLGEFYVGRVYDQASKISRAVAGKGLRDKRNDVAVDVSIDSALGPLRLVGTMPLFNGDVFEYRYGRIRDELRVKLLLQYLVAQAWADKAPNKVKDTAASLIGRGKDNFHPVHCELALDITEARTLLSRISGWTILGLTRPLAFSTADGFYFARKAQKIAPAQRELLLQQTVAAMAQTLKQNAPPEGRALLDTAIIQQGADEFGQIVASVVTPLLLHIREGRL